MKTTNISKNELKYYSNLGININSNYFRNHYKNGLMQNIDEEYINNIQEFYVKHYKRRIDPVTHIAYTNLTKIKDVSILPQRIFRKDFLRTFNDNPLTDIYRDKALYESMFDTNYQVYNVIKRVRGQYYNHENKPISYSHTIDILLNDSKEYIIKPTDTNNGLNIKKLFVDGNTLYLDGNMVDSTYLNAVYGYNFVIQRIIKQHKSMAYLHPSSVNTLRMVTIRWNNKIQVLYTFARFGHSGDIKDNAGAGGVVVGVLDNGKFMDFAIQQSNIIYEHPTTNIKINELGSVPNYEGAKKLAISLHTHILHHNYVAWDLTINQENEPIFIEANFFGNSWTNQIALQQSMLGELTGEILEYIAEHKKKTNDMDVNSLAKKNRLKFRKKIKDTNKVLSNKEKKYKSLKQQFNLLKIERDQLNGELKGIKNSRTWKYTSFLRKR